ncbi:MAG: hypothetical protein NTV01_09965 [Bacteroidia bacterium]|nr:hypothetical protein [Bacteroidia bacterium]
MNLKSLSGLARLGLLLAFPAFILVSWINEEPKTRIMIPTELRNAKSDFAVL